MLELREYGLIVGSRLHSLKQHNGCRVGAPGLGNACMESFEQTRLWRTTLAPIAADSHAEPRGRLRSAFLKFRDRAANLANEIARDLPDLTVHDISHIDALWEMADLILGDRGGLNPCEAFVLGRLLSVARSGDVTGGLPESDQ